MPPATNEATAEPTAPKNLRRVAAIGRKSVAPPGTASATPLPWPRPDWSIDRGSAWNAIVRSVPFRHARSSHAVGCSHRYPRHPTGAENRTTRDARLGTSAPRHMARGGNRKPCGAARRPVRCDDTEPATRHDRHPPVGRRRRTRAHDPLGVAPRPCQRGRTEECPPLSSIAPGRRAGTSIGPGGAVIAARDASLGAGSVPPGQAPRSLQIRAGRPANRHVRAPPCVLPGRSTATPRRFAPTRACPRPPKPGGTRASRTPPWRPQARPFGRRACELRASPERLR